MSGTVILPGATFYTGFDGPVFDKPVSFTAGVAGLTKSSVGLDYVDNTNDLQKPISTATSIALESKANKNNPEFTGNVAVFPVNSIALSSVQSLPVYLNSLENNKANLSGAAFTGDMRQMILQLYQS